MGRYVATVLNGLAVQAAKAAPSVQKTIFDYEGSEKGRGTQDFTAIAAEFLARLESYGRLEQRVANG